MQCGLRKSDTALCSPWCTFEAHQTHASRQSPPGNRREKAAGALSQAGYALSPPRNNVEEVIVVIAWEISIRYLVRKAGSLTWEPDVLPEAKAGGCVGSSGLETRSLRTGAVRSHIRNLNGIADSANCPVGYHQYTMSRKHQSVISSRQKAAIRSCGLMDRFLVPFVVHAS